MQLATQDKKHGCGLGVTRWESYRAVWDRCTLDLLNSWFHVLVSFWSISAYLSFGVRLSVVSLGAPTQVKALP